MIDCDYQTITYLFSLTKGVFVNGIASHHRKFVFRELPELNGGSIFQTFFPDNCQLSIIYI